MRKTVSAITRQILAGGAFAAIAGCNSLVAKDHGATASVDGWCVPIAQYTNHITAAELESLHRIEINDVAGLRAHLQSKLALDVQALWASIQDERTASEDRQKAYGLLRLIAIQDEKFPVPELNNDPKVVAIFQAAIQNDQAHADLLRRQDWSKPKWVKWVD
jgi:hypothetical protein